MGFESRSIRGVIDDCEEWIALADAALTVHLTKTNFWDIFMRIGARKARGVALCPSQDRVDGSSRPNWWYSHVTG
jgi:hypothetical protein